MIIYFEYITRYDGEVYYLFNDICTSCFNQAFFNKTTVLNCRKRMLLTSFGSDRPLINTDTQIKALLSSKCESAVCCFTCVLGKMY